ncbi:MAG: hypothetical protein Q9Q13_12580 [Acidobacteriota bacterium]|nr:hypothetical protein [Acidobacteriota bacterium]
MPFAAKSAEALGADKGGVRSHLFRIDPDADAQMFTEEGGFVRLDAGDQGAVNMAFACRSCHQNVDLALLAQEADAFHDEPLRILALAPRTR